MFIISELRFLHSVWVSWLLMNSSGGSVNILFSINIQTSSTTWTYKTLFPFLKKKLVTTVLSAESRWKLKLRTSKDGPWRPYTLTPHPELEHWLGKGTRSPPYSCWGGFNTHNPSSHIPLPSCSGWRPNASTSHLGLPKPVLTGVGGSMESTHPWR